MEKFIYKNMDGRTTVECDGEMAEIAGEVGHLAHTLFSAYSHNNPILGAVFKSMVLDIMNDEDSPVWKVRVNEPGDLEIMENTYS